MQSEVALRPAEGQADELPAADNVEVFTDLRAYMAALVLLQDQGYVENVSFGDDDDSQRLVRDARRLNRGWKPGMPVRAPLRRVPTSVIAVPERPSVRPRERRPRRVRRSSGSRGDPSRSDGEPEPPLIRWRGFLAASARVHATFQMLIDALIVDSRVWDEIDQELAPRDERRRA